MKSHFLEQPQVDNPDALCPVSGEICPSLTYVLGQKDAAGARVSEYDTRADHLRAIGAESVAIDQEMKADPFVFVANAADAAWAEIRLSCDKGPKTKREIAGLFGRKVTQCSVVLENQTVKPTFLA